MKHKKWIVPICCLAAGSVMIVLGIVREEHRTVLEKAINICLECIGIG